MKAAQCLTHTQTSKDAGRQTDKNEGVNLKKMRGKESHENHNHTCTDMKEQIIKT